MYAFIDSGSAVSVIDTGLADELELEGIRRPLYLEFADNTSRDVRNSRIVCGVIQGTDDKYSIRMRTMDLSLPKLTITEEDLEWAGIKEHPIRLYKNAVPRIMIGLDNARITAARSTNTYKDLVVCDTPLGWTLEGKIGDSPIDGVIGCTKVLEELRNAVSQFIENDNFGIDKKNPVLESAEIQRARKILSEGVKRVKGRYESPLLWKHEQHPMPDNFSYAEHRFISFEKKMENNLELKTTAHDIISKYITKGYIKEVDCDRNSGGWHLPIFSVNNGKKIRLVWDAAAEFRGCSLNSNLLQGPDLNEPLWDILYRFRQWPVAICADIGEMFHQIRTVKEDRKYQRFLWRWKSTEPLKTFEMQVMTFGSNCSPCIAQFVKNENALLFEKTHPDGVKAVLKSHYVDDWVESCRSEKDATKLIKEVSVIQKYAGFSLHKWATNSKTILQDMGLEGEASRSLTNDMKALGVKWITSTDSLKFDIRKVTLSHYFEENPTKREILRAVMSLYDPIGLVSHLVIEGRLVLREVWKIDCDWDEKVPDDIRLRWLNWLQSLKILETLEIPRWCGVLQEHRQIHIFVDASQTAMSAVAYVRGQGMNGINTQIVASKCKVSPMRTISIPRLELQAAVLGTRLGEMILKATSVPITTVTYWTDAKDVLWWINSAKRKYKQFVAIRVSEILLNSKSTEWRWVPGKENPADLGTKPQPNLCARQNLWLEGPTFLRRDQVFWPKEETITPNDPDLEILKVFHMRTSPGHSRIVADPLRVGSWLKMVRVTAWTMRIVNHLARNKAPLSTHELKRAETEILREAQREFKIERDLILGKRSCDIPKTSPLYKLSPFIDPEDPMQLIRMRSRILKANNLSYAMRYPIILPGGNPITKRLVEFYHQIHGHQLHQTVLNELRKKFIIIRSWNTLNKVLKSCQHCAVYRAEPRPPEMAVLPIERLDYGCRPFANVGIDCFGPITITKSRSRQEKRYGLIFTCLTTRAIQIEVLESMTGPDCLAAISIFGNQWTVPDVIRCDNGTNFVWASKNYQGRKGEVPEWKFNPPLAPHMGGVWERMIKTVKNTLNGMQMPEKITQTELRVFLSKVVDVVNSRPLTRVPLRSAEDFPITPNHFLRPCMGENPQTLTEDATLLIGFEENQKSLKIFWQKWSKEYLPFIAARSKWHKKVEPLLIGDLVFLRLDNGWVRGRIEEVFVDPESGQVREVTVFTRQRSYRRAATQVAKISILQQNTDKFTENPQSPQDETKSKGSLSGQEERSTGPVTRSKGKLT